MPISKTKKKIMKIPIRTIATEPMCITSAKNRTINRKNRRLTISHTYIFFNDQLKMQHYLIVPRTLDQNKSIKPANPTRFAVDNALPRSHNWNSDLAESPLEIRHSKPNQNRRIPNQTSTARVTRATIELTSSRPASGRSSSSASLLQKDKWYRRIVCAFLTNLLDICLNMRAVYI